MEKEKLDSIKSKLNDYGSVIGGTKKSLLDDENELKQRKNQGETGIDLAAFRKLSTNGGEDDDDEDDDDEYKNKNDDGL